MSEAITVAVIGGGITAVASVITTVILNNKNQAITNTKLEKSQEFVEYKIGELTKQVEKHNQVIERTYELEKKVQVINEKMNLYHHD